MRILNWNIRGAGRKGFLAQLKYLLSTHKPDILALTETRVNSSKAWNIISIINIPNFIEILPKDYSGFGYSGWITLTFMSRS